MAALELKPTSARAWGVTTWLVKHSGSPEPDPQGAGICLRPLSENDRHVTYKLEGLMMYRIRVFFYLYLNEHKLMNTAHARSPYSLALILVMNTATLSASRAK